MGGIDGAGGEGDSGAETREREQVGVHARRISLVRNIRLDFDRENCVVEKKSCGVFRIFSMLYFT